MLGGGGEVSGKEITWIELPDCILKSLPWLAVSEGRLLSMARWYSRREKNPVGERSQGRATEERQMSHEIFPSVLAESRRETPTQSPGRGALLNRASPPPPRHLERGGRMLRWDRLKSGAEEFQPFSTDTQQRVLFEKGHGI